MKIRIDELTFRLIVGGPVAPTQRLSNLLDIILKPLCHNVKSFVRDDLDFLRHLPDHVESNRSYGPGVKEQYIYVQ